MNDSQEEATEIAFEIHKRLNKLELEDSEVELENLISLVMELKTSYPELNNYSLYNITLSDVFRIINENNFPIEINLTVKEPLTVELLISENGSEQDEVKEKSVLLLLVLLLFLEQSHLVISITFKKNKNKFLIPFQSYFSFLSRNSLLVTGKFNRNFHYVMSVHSALADYGSANFHLTDQIDRCLQNKLNKSHISSDGLLDYPVGSKLEQNINLYHETMRKADRLAQRLAMDDTKIFSLHNKLRLF